MDKIEFKCTINGAEKELAVIKPTRQAMNESQIIYNQAFREALDKDMMLRAKIDDYLRRQNLWDDKKEQEYTELQQVINSGKRRLETGGIKLSEARKIALEMREARATIRELISIKVQLDNNSAEGVAQAAQFDSLVSSCVVYNLTGERVFKNYQDYLNKAYEPWVNLAASYLSKLMYGLEDDYEKKLPENAFLIKRGFVDEKLRLVNKDGHLIDDAGRLINEEGRLVNEKGELVDVNGYVVDVEGNYKTEFSPFLDDDGNPIEDSVPPLALPGESVVTAEVEKTE